MRRGFPRPMTFVEKTHSNPYRGTRGSFGKKYENKKYPHPYTAKEDSIARIDTPRQAECVRFKKCSVCGETVEEDLVGLVLYNEKAYVRGRHKDWLNRESGPFHLRCLSITFKLCPHLAETKIFMPAVALWKDVRADLMRANGIA